MDYENFKFNLASINNNILEKTKDIQKTTYPDGLSYEYGFIVSYICDNKDNMLCAKDIEDKFKINKSSLSVILKDLEKDGLIERKTILNDLRFKKIAPTEAALMINEACKIQNSTYISSLFKEISNEEKEIFINVLSKITNNL